MVPEATLIVDLCVALMVLSALGLSCSESPTTIIELYNQAHGSGAGPVRTTGEAQKKNFKG